jgi:hypothetical protein
MGDGDGRIQDQSALEYALEAAILESGNEDILARVIRRASGAGAGALEPRHRDMLQKIRMNASRNGEGT